MTKCREKVLALAAGTGFMLMAPTLYAQVPGAYIGVGAGVANFEDNVEVQDIGDVDIDDDSTAYRLYGGYRATENLAIEGGYRNFGEADAGPFSVETDGFDLTALGLVPVGPVDLFAKGGVILWDTDGVGGFPGDDGEALTYGLGGQLNVGNLWFRLESEWFDMDLPDDTQMITASVGWSFQ
jgi:OOP family OmpA-OmpF porin